MTPLHSPLPWTVNEVGDIVDAKGKIVVYTAGIYVRQDRSYIAFSATNYEKMRKALESLAKVLEKVQADLKWIAMTHDLPEPTMAALGEVIATICDPELAVLAGE